MKLKKLEILGFKSFADKTKLEFHPGITAIVGPNGCGKSNISDAFRWVLGEQSAKSMRGSRMPDVIFAGTATRKPLNFAEVTITLSDINGKLPIDYDEIAVTRRLHRNGESEYFINKHLVRLKDVQALFLDSGMGKDAYSIFEQGKIDQVINLSSLERRYIFEEAAGILRFLQRKKEALRKLEQTDSNVSRVKDIHKEVERQIIVLEEQAEKARLYKEHKNALERLEKCAIVCKWEALHSKLQDLKTKINTQDTQIAGSNANIETLQIELQEAKQALTAAEKKLKAQGESVFSARSSKELQLKERQTNQERLRDIAAKEKRWQSELEIMAEKRISREQERKELVLLQNETEERFQELNDIVKLQRQRLKILEEKLAKERELQQTKQKELFKLMQQESQCEGEIRQVNVRLESSQERSQRVVERKERLSQSASELLKHNAEKKHELQEAIVETEKHKEIFVAMEGTLKEIALEMDKTQEDMDRTSQDLSEHKARYKVLQHLREEMEGFSLGSKQLLKESSNSKSPLFNKIKGLYEYLVPEKGAEAAVAAVMKPYVQTLVIQTEEDFQIVLDHVKKQGIKDVSFICVESLAKIKNSKKAQPSDILSELSISVVENELSNHFLRETYLGKRPLSAIDAIKTHAGFEIWLQDGTFVDRRSVLFFSSQGENNVFLREAELKALDKKLQETEQEKQKLGMVLQAIQQKRHHIQSERTELDKTIRRAEMKLVELNFAVQKSTADLEKMGVEDKMLTADWQAVKASIESLVVSLQELNERHKSAKENVLAAQKQTEQLTSGLSKLVEQVKIEAADLHTKEKALNAVIDMQRKQIHSLHVLEVKDLESLQQEKRLEEEIEIGQSFQKQIISKSTEVEKQLEEVEISLQHAVAGCNELEQQTSVRKSALEHLENKIHEKRLSLKKHEAERNQSVIHSTQLESNIQSLENELGERHKMSVSEARDFASPLEKSLEQIEKQIRHLRQQIENAGDINMTSIEECEKHKTRYHFLNQQLDDLGLSKSELVAIIADLDGESRKIFQDTFQKIRFNFRKNFEVLFNGGEADLQFTESDDVLEAGIEIIAKPPGKQMRSIQLLSGGEKCLTAMALLFAIFEVKPAPFCILDEIDAPLDDANVERFVNIVKLFVEGCQFIIITHNKRTMAIADVICGVSMEERGVSKLLSVDFSKNEAPEMASL